MDPLMRLLEHHEINRGILAFFQSRGYSIEIEIVVPLMGCELMSSLMGEESHRERLVLEILPLGEDVGPQLSYLDFMSQMSSS